MKIGEATQWLQNQLRMVYDERESQNIAVLVLDKITGMYRHGRMKNYEQQLSEEQLHKLKDIVQCLLQHEPVQYVLNECYFYGLKLYVDKHVLIPRPETEELVHWIIDDVKKSGKEIEGNIKNKTYQSEVLKILDVGSGSGCIALTLKKSLPEAEVWGCDISSEALNVARINGAALNIRVDFLQMDILDAARWNSLPVIDIIVSNPPYITQQEMESMAANVVLHEPHIALFVPDENPLIFYKVLGMFGKEKLKPNGCLYVEIHEEQGKAVMQLFQNLMYQNVQLKQDMQGKDRMIKAKVGN